MIECKTLKTVLTPLFSNVVLWYPAHTHMHTHMHTHTYTCTHILTAHAHTHTHITHTHMHACTFSHDMEDSFDEEAGSLSSDDGES